MSLPEPIGQEASSCDIAPDRTRRDKDKDHICRCLLELGIVAEADAETRTRMAFGMFDTRGKVDPFDPDSPIKKGGITAFPGDLFFVLRVVQLIRGMASGEYWMDLFEPVGQNRLSKKVFPVIGAG